MRRYLPPVLAALLIGVWARMWEHRAARGPLAVAAVVAIIALAVASAGRTGRRIRGSGRDPSDVGDASAAGPEHESPGHGG